ncbi:Protein kinase-like domain [Cordyceps militaris CM01]|uniref:Protein kinase-like domain n=1 Tax=Cordyceps militaris (strain CM01) TaxID=983644 RepID=G3JU54_CORMM|nr:Protein kinase-like domain [Cordyceps militaris CM01]EGX87775.1 Protein kinase-like domain [Cordyceps militaris CM01]
MAWVRDWLFFGAAWCHFVAAAAATDAPVLHGCDGDGTFGPPFNATGTVSFATKSFTHNNGRPWYLSVGLKDRRDKNAAYPGVQAVTGYLSLPDDYVRSARTNTTQMCVYHMGQRNTTASPDGSCQGIIDDACAKLIHEFQESPSFSDGKCPLLPSDDVCGSQIFQLGTSSLSDDYRIEDEEEKYAYFEPISDTPITLMRSNCSTSVQPALAGLPDAYNTQLILDLELPYGDTKVDDFTAFDAHFAQFLPFLGADIWAGSRRRLRSGSGMVVCCLMMEEGAVGGRRDIVADIVAGALWRGPSPNSTVSLTQSSIHFKLHHHHYQIAPSEVTFLEILQTKVEKKIGNLVITYKVEFRKKLCVMKVFKDIEAQDTFYTEASAYRLLKEKGFCKRGLVPKFYGTLDAILIEYIPNAEQIDLSNFSQDNIDTLSEILFEFHEAGLIHGDPYPRNMMVVQGVQTPDRVFWLDFDHSQMINKTCESSQTRLELEKELMTGFAKALSEDAKAGKLEKAFYFYC